MKLGPRKSRADVCKHTGRDDQLANGRGLDESDSAGICNTNIGWATKR
jgi:hypothetical protein